MHASRLKIIHTSFLSLQCTRTHTTPFCDHHPLTRTDWRSSCRLARSLIQTLYTYAYRSLSETTVQHICRRASLRCLGAGRLLTADACKSTIHVLCYGTASLHRSQRNAAIRHATPLGECVGIIGPGDTYGVCVWKSRGRVMSLSGADGGNLGALGEVILDLCAREP